NFAMERAGMIVGTVTSANVPLSGVTIAAYNLSSGTRRGFTQTAANGNYALLLPPGQYKIAAYDESGNYAVSFYPNALTFSSAGTLPLAPGQQLAADFQLPLSGHLTGTVVDSDTNVILPGASVFAYTTDGTAAVGTTLTDAAGRFSLAV